MCKHSAFLIKTPLITIEGVLNYLFCILCYNFIYKFKLETREKYQKTL